MSNWLRWFVSDKSGKVVIWQTPNFQLLLWLGLVVVSRLTTGFIHETASYLSTFALVFWAGFELAWGDSPFRRVLGLMVICYIVISRLG